MERDDGGACEGIFSSVLPVVILTVSGLRVHKICCFLMFVLVFQPQELKYTAGLIVNAALGL